MTDAPPLAGIRVLEFAGLAPGPFAGLLLADYGATVLRLDRANSSPTRDPLTRRKRSIRVSIKKPRGVALVKSLVRAADVVIDPFRPGVLEKAGLSPEEVLLKINPRLVVARMTGFRRDGKYRDMAGHDINYLAVSGVLAMLGRRGEKPYAPGNIVGDFAGGGAVCFMGILLALFARERNGGRGQVVEANMVDGSAALATFPRLLQKTPMWDQPRGENVLDGGCPWYDTYETSDGEYMAVGALEPQFFAAFLKGLSIDSSQLTGERENRSTWPHLRHLFTARFKSKTRKEWETVFDGTDACCTPVFSNNELQAARYDQRPIVTLKTSPGLATNEKSGDADVATGQGEGVEGGGWNVKAFMPGNEGEETLTQWMGWSLGLEFQEVDGGFELFEDKAKL